MGARRYSAATGRFLQVDLYYDALSNLGLSEDPLTQNRYALAGANPINFVEVDGHVAAYVDEWGQDAAAWASRGGSIDSEVDEEVADLPDLDEDELSAYRASANPTCFGGSPPRVLYSSRPAFLALARAAADEVQDAGRARAPRASQAPRSWLPGSGRNAFRDRPSRPKPPIGTFGGQPTASS